MCTTSCNTQSSTPEDGQNNYPKYGIINKPLLLHLVGVCIKLLQIRQRALNIVGKVTLLQSKATHAPHSYALLQSEAVDTASGR